jgi:phosphopantothenoylcysteine synthetase/decarboxylase
VRSEFRGPDEPEFDPRGDALLVAPATFNTINKCALGASDSLALGLMNEALGTRGLPMAVVPWVNTRLAGHPAYEPSLGRLQGAGTHIITPASNDPDGFDGALQQAVEWLASASGRVRPPG